MLLKVKGSSGDSLTKYGERNLASQIGFPAEWWLGSSMTSSVFVLCLETVMLESESRDEQ